MAYSLRFTFFVVIFAAFAIGVSFTVRAEDRDFYLLNQPVEERVPNEFRQDGLQYRGFILKPSLLVEASYNDNFYASEDNATEEYYTTLKPSLEITKPYGRNLFSFYATGAMSKHAENSNEDKEEYLVNTTGNLTFGSNYRLKYALSAQKDFIERYDQTAGDLTVKPIAKQTNAAELGFAKRFNRLHLEFLNHANHITYDNGISRENGNVEIYDDNDRKSYKATVRAGYSIMGSGERREHIVYAEASRKVTRFDNERAGNGTTGDNTQIGMLAGLFTRYKGLVFGNIALGFYSQDFDDYKDVTRFDFDADLTFNLTPKTSLIFNAGRDTIQDNGYKEGYDNTDFQIGVDHELQHDLYIGASQRYNLRSYLGSNEGREDQNHITDLYLRKHFSPYLEGNIKLQHTTRDSNVPNNSYDRNILMFSLTGKI